MKKAIFAVLIVLLAMLAVTCDSAVFPARLASGTGEVPYVEPDWKTISINVGDSNGLARAMSQTLNQSEVDFFEVVFDYYNGAVTVRDTETVTAGQFPTGWTLTVPAAYYEPIGDNKAILYAGKSDGTILIATAVGTANFTLATTNSISFTLEAIENPSPISIPGAAAGTVTDPDGLTGSFPVYKIDEDATEAATYTFEIPENANAVVSAAGTATVEHVSAPSPSPNPATITTSALTPGAGTALGETAAFGFNIIAGSSLGYGKIHISVPVNAVNGNTTAGKGPAATTWHLVGGLNNSTLADGDTTDGGAFLIEVVAVVTPPSPSLSIDIDLDVDEEDSLGWDGDTKTWTVSTGANESSENLEEDIVLKATASDFVPGTGITYQWKMASSTTPDPDNDDDVEDTVTSIPGVTGETTDTLTIPNTSAKLGTPGTFYVYCVATEGTQTAVTEDVITIEVTNNAVPRAGIEIGNGGNGGSISW